MIRRLGGRRWQAVHRLVYAAAIASVVHRVLASRACTALRDDPWRHRRTATWPRLRTAAAQGAARDCVGCCWALMVSSSSRYRLAPRALEAVVSLKGKTLFITGASRGIGLAIAYAPPATAPRRDRRQDSRAAPEAARHDLHRGEGDRGGGRQGAAHRLSTSATKNRSRQPSRRLWTRSAASTSSSTTRARSA